jgi:hypothetical protein
MHIRLESDWIMHNLGMMQARAGLSTQEDEPVWSHLFNTYYKFAYAYALCKPYLHPQKDGAPVQPPEALEAEASRSNSAGCKASNDSLPVALTQKANIPLEKEGLMN